MKTNVNYCTLLQQLVQAEVEGSLTALIKVYMFKKQRGADFE